MAAAGACFAGGAHLHDIRAGLRTFSTNYHLAPGRLNHIDVNGVNVFVDYAHNAAGLEALGEFIASYTDGLDAARAEVHKRRRIGVIGTAGDRRDSDILELGRTGARHFDLVRGQGGPQAARSPARRGGGPARAGCARRRWPRVRAPRRCARCPMEIDAVRWAVEQANAGDVVAICADQTDSVYTELEALGHSAMHE